MAIRGNCLFGAVSYEIAGSFKAMGNCHCSICRKSHDAAFATWGIIAPHQFRWTLGESFIQEYESSPGRKRCFCKTCGSPLVSTHSGAVGEVVVGTVDGDPGARPGEHVLVGSKAIWYEIADALPQFEECPGDATLTAGPPCSAGTDRVAQKDAVHPSRNQSSDFRFTHICSCRSKPSSSIMTEPLSTRNPRFSTLAGDSEPPRRASYRGAIPNQLRWSADGRKRCGHGVALHSERGSQRPRGRKDREHTGLPRPRWVPTHAGCSRDAGPASQSWSTPRDRHRCRNQRSPLHSQRAWSERILRNGGLERRRTSQQTSTGLLSARRGASGSSAVRVHCDRGYRTRGGCGDGSGNCMRCHTDHPVQPPQFFQGNSRAA